MPFNWYDFIGSGMLPKIIDKANGLCSNGKYLFGLMLNVTVNGYGHVGMVSPPNHTFLLGKLD